MAKKPVDSLTVKTNKNGDIEVSMQGFGDVIKHALDVVFGIPAPPRRKTTIKAVSREPETKLICK